MSSELNPANATSRLHFPIWKNIHAQRRHQQERSSVQASHLGLGAPSAPRQLSLPTTKSGQRLQDAPRVRLREGVQTSARRKALAAKRNIVLALLGNKLVAGSRFPALS